MEWRLNVTTPIEFSKQILYYTNSNFDFTEICNQINNLIYLCLVGNFLTLFWIKINRLRTCTLRFKYNLSCLYFLCFRRSKHAQLSKLTGCFHSWKFWLYKLCKKLRFFLIISIAIYVGMQENSWEQNKQSIKYRWIR